jgi:ubiquinone/menaquinone biosynthesis C-methylase UbiE
LDRCAARPGEFVLDIGCGWGGLAVALARRVAPGGQVLGVDVSELMLARARELRPRGLPVEFALGDATVYPFTPGRADLLCSRFGVMFFADPARSFTNMRRGLRSGARVAFVCWREPRANPWLMLPLQEAYRHVPRLPEVGPEDPGAFSFAAERRVRDILERAGFDAIRLEPCARGPGGRGAGRRPGSDPRGARRAPGRRPRAARRRDLDRHRRQSLRRTLCTEGSGRLHPHVPRPDSHSR